MLDVGVFCLHGCLWTTWEPVTHKDEKRCLRFPRNGVPDGCELPCLLGTECTCSEWAARVFKH